ncbi:DUF2178 domain-containing protein [Patescibacteria group bacterium]
MDLKQFSLIRITILLLIGVIVLTAFLINNLYLAIAAFLIGMLFIFLVKEKYKKVIIDERVLTVSGQAARMTHIFITLLLGMFSLFFIFSGQNNEDYFSESLGVIFGYLAIFNIALYAIFFHYFNKKYGGDK